MTTKTKETKTPRKKRRRWQEPALPIGAVVDTALHDEISALATRLPQTFGEIADKLDEVSALVEYDAALHHANGLVMAQVDTLLQGPLEDSKALLAYANTYLPPEACVPICRRLVKAPSPEIQRKAQRLAQRKRPADVALPSGAEKSWDFEGWMKGTEPGRLEQHKTGVRAQKAAGVPHIKTVAALRDLLGIQSPKQLGYLLLSSELADGEGPYVRFSIPKRSGEDRPIAAPRFMLKHAQRRILDQILASQPTHDAAHGFVKSRSIVTNAAKHQGRKLLIKFDLHDFFPTIHYFRVVGLFTSLGYTRGTGGFSSDDESIAIAPTLARLCCYVSPDKSWGEAALPQGAPTSPAIANLICRGLDGRLAGLATAMKGTYTRYADDLTFSFDEVPNLGIGRFRWWVDQICQQEGFSVNQHKFRVVRSSQRQMVTGIVVNETLRVPRKERRKFRAIVHNCQKHGIASQARGRPYFASYLQGFASYIHMVHPEEGKVLMVEVEALLAKEREQLSAH